MTQRLILLLLFVTLLAVAPILAQDLSIQQVQVVGTPKAGSCNKVRVAIRNNSNELINVITKADVIAYPQGTPNQNRSQKATFYSAIQPGAIMSREVNGLGFLAGPGNYTLQVVIDSENKVAETNENNNSYTSNINVSQTCGGAQGACDLKAVSMNPAQSSLPASYAANVSVKFRNIGNQQCPSKQVEFRRYTGSGTNGSYTALGTKTLNPINPNYQKSVGISDNNHGAGVFTYAYEVMNHADASPANHNNLYKVVTFSAPGGGGGGGANPRGCDIKANFTHPTNNHPAGNSSLNWRIFFKNQGTANCNKSKVKLMRYGSSCGGYGTQIGGSGAFRQLEALASGGNMELTFNERRTPKRGAYCYKLVYAGAYNDDNNSNHRPYKKVTFQ